MDGQDFHEPSGISRVDRLQTQGAHAMNYGGRVFGQHVRSYRRARRLTQEALAELSGLSADTIRRLEHGSFSPSLETLSKLCRGLRVSISTLFEAYELCERNVCRELLDIVTAMSRREQLVLVRLLPLMSELLSCGSEGGEGDDGG